MMGIARIFVVLHSFTKIGLPFSVCVEFTEVKFHNVKFICVHSHFLIGISSNGIYGIIHQFSLLPNRKVNTARVSERALANNTHASSLLTNNRNTRVNSVFNIDSILLNLWTITESI